MIVYFASRQMKILGHAATGLPKGFVVIDDAKTEEVETGIATFSCEIAYEKENQLALADMVEVGNYVLRSNDDGHECYTIIDAEIDTESQTAYIYAEDVGLDLLNEVVGEFEATEPHDAEWYINKYILDAGFFIGKNEIPYTTVRQLSWQQRSTATERVADIAKQFGDYEISFSFDIKGLAIVKRYVNIHQKRGQDIGAQLRLNQDINRIVTKKTVSNLATELVCVGGTPEDANVPVNLEGYTYDDGDFYVEGTSLKSRNAYNKWGRLNGGHIAKLFEDDALTPLELCQNAIAELKEICDLEVNYEADINNFPDNIRVGDRINIIDDAGELYVSTRILVLETSITKQKQKATLGEHIIKTSGISQKVSDLAAKFAKQTISVQRAKATALSAKTEAEAAQVQANTAATEAENAQAVADEAKAAADTATQSAAEATEKANLAQAAVDVVEESVSYWQTTVVNAQAAADNAYTAAETAQAKADEAKAAAEKAEQDAADAKAAAGTAQETADSAVTNAAAAVETAGQAKTTAEAAQTEAASAKADAEQAEKDVAAFGETLETVRTTMEADYTRKTEFTETTASLQTQITQNAEEISVTNSKLLVIDETANNAADLAEQAQSEAATAQQQADKATEDAAAAQTAADAAAAAATAAQNEADTAKAAAATAQGVADKAEEDLEAAKADLATVTARVDATEEEITAAQQAVTTAQAAADKAKEDAAAAATKAADAQSTADTAVTNASNAQAAADEAASKANLAQQTADEAKGNAEEAKAIADAAAEAAEAAQATADTAKTNAANAQATADAAAQAAADAQTAADNADAKAAQAAFDLATAQQNLADVQSRVDATEDEVEAAQAAVVTAQAAADKAKADAVAAQATADTAKANAATAQAAADTAKAAADNAQAEAEAAKAAADKAQEDVDALAVRVTSAETEITKNAEEIALRATKDEVTQTLGGYYTKAETDAAISVKSDEINLSVSEKIAGMEIGGRNLLYGNRLVMLHTNNPDLYPITCEGMEENGVSFYRVKRTDSSLSPNTLSIFNSILKTSFNYAEMVGQQVTLSLKARASRDVVVRFMNYAYSGSTQIGFGKAAETITTEWQTFSVTIDEFPEIEDGGGVRWCPYMLSLVDGEFDTFFLDVRDWKFEKGNKATDWTPAPEDLQSIADMAQNTADGNAIRITEAESTIKQLADSISMLVTDGNGASLMQQTENGWTFSMGTMQDTVDGISAGLDDLTNEIGDVNSAVSVLDQAVKDLGEVAEYVKIDVYEDEPCIELGESDSDFKLLITNTRIMFMEGDNIPTYISNKGLNTENITVENEMRITAPETTGAFVWKIRSNGNMGLTWAEVAD